MPVFVNLIGCLVVMAASAEVYHAPNEQRVSPEILRALQQVAGGQKPHEKYPVPAMGEEAPSRAVDPLQFKEMIDRAREKSVTAPQNIAIPKSAFAPVSPSATSTPVSEQPVAIPVPSNYLWHSILMTLLAMGGAAFIARLLVPELGDYLSNALKSSRMVPSRPADSSVELLAEEKAAAAFHADFCPLPRAGVPSSPPASASESSPVKEASQVPGSYQLALQGVQELQSMLLDVNLSPDERHQRLALRKLAGPLKSLKTLAEEAGLRPLGQFVSAVELLVERLFEKEGSLNSSVLRTLGQAITVIGELCRPDLNANLLVDPPLRILAVDDEAFSRFALCQSLERTLSKPELADSAAKALELAKEHPYDLIFLDVIMPAMDGFELCPKIHDTEPNANTPVVFLTSLNDLNSRSQAVVSGGRDFMVKPFQTFEVTVKALTLITHERLRGRGLAAGGAALKPSLQLAC